MAPKPPDVRHAPAQPGRASVSRGAVGHGHGGPEMAPKPPDVRHAPAQPGRASVSRGAMRPSLSFSECPVKSGPHVHAQPEMRRCYDGCYDVATRSRPHLVVSRTSEQQAARAARRTAPRKRAQHGRRRRQRRARSRARPTLPGNRSAKLAEIARQRLDLGLAELELRHTGGRLVDARVPQSSLDLVTAEASADLR